jgi:apolipoprotein N-acyltransferase
MKPVPPPAEQARGQVQAPAPTLLRPAPSPLFPPLLALTSGVLLFLCYFPAACGWLAWVALVPLLCLVRMELSARRLFFFALLGGGVFFIPALQWMRVADHRMYVTWIGLALYCSFFVPAAVLLVRRLDRRTRLPLLVTLPAVWTALEYFRAHVMTGFPWYFLGYSQHGFLPVCQVADLGGVYAVTFLVAGVNVIVFEWLDAWPWFRRFFALRDVGRGRLVMRAALVLGLLSAVLGYGGWRLGQEEFTAGPRLALIQGNLDQRIRNQAAADNEKARVDMESHYEKLTNQAAVLDPRPDLIVWPETSYPDYWIEEHLGQPDGDSLRLVQEVAGLWRTNVLLGINSIVRKDDGPQRKYNSAVLIHAKGTDGKPAGRYDKIHRVPFGEYVPLRDWLPWMNRLAPYDFDYSISAGESQTRLPLGDHRFGVLICYEDTDPYLARQYVRRDDGQAAADFLLNISNDGWFNGTSEHEEHLAICRFRAIECRRAVARAVNMGVSAIIDGNGRVLKPNTLTSGRGAGPAPVWEVIGEAGRLVELPPADWGRFKKVAGVLVGAIPIDHRFSLYAAWGDWLPQACWFLVLVGLIWSFLHRRRGLVSSP